MNYISRCIELRNKIYSKSERKFLISRLYNSEQENDLSAPPNCDGYGRIRHFSRKIADNWGFDPLPIDPAIKALNLSHSDFINAQVFQVAVCNLLCWYCFVPDSLKCADQEKASWLSADDIVSLFMKVERMSPVLDLSGGNPELVPELIVDTLRALEKYKLDRKIYLWSDDSLSTDFFFRYLRKDEIEYIKGYSNYGRVCCFKGYDERSFAFNTCLEPDLFKNQIEYFKRLYYTGIDLYGYITLTSDFYDDTEDRIYSFIKQLQEIHINLPLRIVPLKIITFTPTKKRLSESRKMAIENQEIADYFWRKILANTYDKVLLEKRICDIDIH